MNAEGIWALLWDATLVGHDVLKKHVSNTVDAFCACKDPISGM